jgi:hypothetical protein
MSVDTARATLDETRRTEDAVRAVLEAFGSGDVEGLLAAYADDGAFTYVDMWNPGVVITTRAGLLEWLEEFSAACEPLPGGQEVVSVTAQGSRAVVELGIKATYTGEGAPAGGADVTIQACVVFGMTDAGLVQEERVYGEPIEGQIARAMQEVSS